MSADEATSSGYRVARQGRSMSDTGRSATIRIARIFDGETMHPEGGVVVTDRGRIGELR